MRCSTLRSAIGSGSLLVLALAGNCLPLAAQHYMQTNLTADQAGMATNTDMNLVNPWGLARSSGSPWWISDNGTGVSTLYDGTGAAKPLVVTIPPADPNANSTGTPTGTVFNGGTEFALAPGKPALFLFVTEDGTVSGWNPGVLATAAKIMVNTKGSSVFKGAALVSAPDKSGVMLTYMYVADFREGRVQVYDGSFNRLYIEDAFRDESLPDGYTPFNVQNIGGDLYVTFAKQDSAKHDEIDGAGKGFVDVFSPMGRLLRRFEHGWWLNGPWGVAQAPADFGVYSHDILVGQFGSGNIAVYDPVTGKFKDVLRAVGGNPITISGLWGLSFGSGSASGSATTLYFSAGTDGEQHGLFGTITPVENTLGNSQ